MRADAARVPGGFVDADDSHLISAQDGWHVAPRDTRHARSAPLQNTRGARRCTGAERRHLRSGLWVGRVVPSV